MDEAAIRGRTARTIGHSQGVSEITVLSQSANDQAPAPSRYVVASWKGCTARLDVRTGPMMHRQREAAYSIIITCLLHAAANASSN